MPAAREHFKQHSTEREDVAPMIGAAVDLLGRHVRQRAHHGAIRGEHRLREIYVAGVITIAQSREPEVEKLNPRRREHDVAGLDVAMDDLMLVREAERIGQLRRDRQGLIDGNPRLAAMRRVASVCPCSSSITMNWSPS